QILLSGMFHWLPNITLLPVLALNAVIFVLAIDRYAQTRRSLTTQLETFDVRQSRCAFESDRETVYHTIRQWFTDLDAFNTNVRENVRDHVVKSLGHEFHFPKRLTFPPMLFSIFTQLDRIAAGDFETQTVFKVFAFVADVPRLGALIPMFIVMAYCFSKMARRWLGCLLFILCSLSVQMLLTFGEQVLHEGTPIWICIAEITSQWMLFIVLLELSPMLSVCRRIMALRLPTG
ncbi:unnamed protein product, partial [Symbiodinium pilosum]